MTLQDMLTEIPKLSTEERLLLLEAISRSLRQPQVSPSPAEEVVNRLYGALRPAGPLPTDAEVDQVRLDRLLNLCDTPR